MKDFRDLQVWEKSHKFTLKVYSLTRKFPREEQYGLVSQFRRSASSTPTNISEGCGRASDIEFARFLEIGFSSASESQYLAILSRDLHYIDPEEYKDVMDDVSEIKRMLSALIKKLRADR